VRTIVIGDIHGAYKCLMDVLEKAGPADRVIFLGDYVDGLPQTYEVIEHIRQMKNAVCVRGNHDQWALDWMKSCKKHQNFSMLPERIHYDQGGKSTYDSYMGLRSTEKAMAEHRDFLEGTVQHYLDEENRLFVHGGVTSLGIADPWMVKMWDRSLMRNAYDLFHSTRALGAPDPAPFSDFKEIYVGHTATRFLTGKQEVANWLNLWAMDTDCGWGGPLCAMDIDTKECFYSRPSKEYYPDFNGR
jgi:serine/threonine protein phosphatase 1